jgi:regulation of enolase protein 1 (concanavalin A-like superfamily)
MTKEQRREYERGVNHIGVQVLYVRSRWSHVPITFTQADLQLREYPHNDDMVINIIHNILVDNGSAADVLMKRTFVKMGLEEKDLHPSLNPMCGFGG